MPEHKRVNVFQSRLGFFQILLRSLMSKHLTISINHRDQPRLSIPKGFMMSQKQKYQISKIPNPKIQIPNKFQLPKFQIPNKKCSGQYRKFEIDICLEIGTCILEFICHLCFVFWIFFRESINLEQTPHSIACIEVVDNSSGDFGKKMLTF